jgi:hypothetical protein
MTDADAALAALRALPCPEIYVTPMNQYTTTPGGFTHYGLVTGTGLSVDQAFAALHGKAAEYVRNHARATWDFEMNGSVSRGLHHGVRDAPGSVLVANFVLVAVRIAGGIVGGPSGWCAYGTVAAVSAVSPVVVQKPGG